MKVHVLLAAIGVLGATGLAQAAGFASYFAVVAPNGAVSRSSGVASAQRTAAGTYTITFNRNVNADCGQVASVRGATPGFATVNVDSGKTLIIKTFSATGAAANLPFNLIITCAS